VLRSAQYKLIYDPREGSYELYDLVKDPQETSNVVHDPDHAKAFKELAAQLEAWQKDKPPVPVIAGVKPQPPGGSSGDAKASRREMRKARR